VRSAVDQAVDEHDVAATGQAQRGETRVAAVDRQALETQGTIQVARGERDLSVAEDPQAGQHDVLTRREVRHAHGRIDVGLARRRIAHDRERLAVHRETGEDRGLRPHEDHVAVLRRVHRGLDRRELRVLAPDRVDVGARQRGRQRTREEEGRRVTLDHGELRRVMRRALDGRGRSTDPAYDGFGSAGRRLAEGLAPGVILTGATSRAARSSG
jgi:hypothetical protein